MLHSETLLQNRYQITRNIGGGGMGTVYLADDRRLQGRRCAIKEMSPAELAPQDRNWSIEAFRQEAQLLAQLHHPGLTAVTDFFAEDGNWYLVMDYVEGETLTALLSRSPGGRFAIQEALRITRQLLDVLDYLHKQPSQVIFRDLKPSNVMLTPEGQVKLIDFGIARFFKPGKTEDTATLGTPGYAAPEQYGGMGQSGPQTDIYSLGVVLNQMVTGYDPATAMSPFPIPDPRSLMPSVPAHIASVITRATQMRPDLRYATVEEMRQELFPPTYPLPGQPTQRAPRQVTGTTAIPQPRPQAKAKRSPWIPVGVVAGLAGLGLCVVAGLYLVANLGQSGRETATVTTAPPATTSKSAPTATVPLQAAETATQPPATQTITSSPIPTERVEPTAPVAAITESSIGQSVQGRTLAATIVGYDGGRAVVVVGSIQGDQGATRVLVQELISHYRANLIGVPMGVAYHFVPALNPDGLAASSRYNAHTVDLNRNWASADWKSNAAVPGYPNGKAGAGGAQPFSEPETRALRDYLLSLRTTSPNLTVVIVHSSVNRNTGEVYPGGTGSLEAARVYAAATGYDVENAWAEYVTSGEAVTWCSEQGMVAIDIVIPASQKPSDIVAGNRTLLQITVQALTDIGR